MLIIYHQLDTLSTYKYVNFLNDLLHVLFITCIFLIL